MSENIKKIILARVMHEYNYKNNTRIPVHIMNLICEFNPSFARGKKRDFLSYFSKQQGARFTTKIGRFLGTKLELNKDFKSSDIQSMTTKISEEMFKSFTIEIVKGSQITVAYKISFGHSSCMTNEYCKYTKLYESNSDRISMIKVHKNQEQARCILWTLDSGGKYADRIYCNSSDARIALENCISLNKWPYFRSAEESENKLKVSNLVYKDGEVPYMDTFMYGVLKCVNGVDLLDLSNKYVKIRKDGTNTSLQNTNGRIYNDDNDEGDIECDYCNEFFAHNNIENIPGYGYVCEDCYGEFFSECKRCGNTIHIGDIQEIILSFFPSDIPLRNNFIVKAEANAKELLKIEKIEIDEKIQEYIIAIKLNLNRTDESKKDFIKEKILRPILHRLCVMNLSVILHSYLPTIITQNICESCINRLLVTGHICHCDCCGKYVAKEFTANLDTGTECFHCLHENYPGFYKEETPEDIKQGLDIRLPLETPTEVVPKSTLASFLEAPPRITYGTPHAPNNYVIWDEDFMGHILD